MPELTELKITAAEAIAVAAKRCAAKWPENFGPVEDLDAHHRRMTNVKAALDKSMDELRETWTQKDLTLCEDDLTQTERDRGLTRVVFRLAPHLRPGQPDWPPLLVAHVLQTSIGKRASRKVEKAKVVRRSTALAASV